MRMYQYGPGNVRTLTSDFTSSFLWRMYDSLQLTNEYICTCTTFGLLVFFTWGILSLQSDWSLSCDYGFVYAS